MTPIGETQTLASMLASGEIDALHTARMPSTFSMAGGPVRRLFPNYKEVEEGYYRKTGIFPMMHTVVIRRDVYEANRWVAQALYKAFVEAQRRTYEDLYVTAALKAMLPWLTSHVGGNARAHGRRLLGVRLRAQSPRARDVLGVITTAGLSKRLLKPEDLFAPESMESFNI